MNTDLFHNSVYTKFEVYMQSRNNSKIIYPLHNAIIRSEEGYKLKMALDAQKESDTLFGALRDKNPKTNEVLMLVKEWLSSQRRGNLVAWRCAETAIKIIENAIFNSNERAASVFRALYCGQDDELAFEQVKSLFGAHFDLIAYLFFLKDCNQYLPIKPTIFDRIFNDYNIDCPRLSWNVDYTTYQSYIDVIKSTQKELISRYRNNSDNEPISLLDAHSFIWILGEDNFISFNETAVGSANILTDVREKEHNIISYARIGQGEYRSQMLDYWDNKCAVTGCENTDVLLASHAKPWKDSDKSECRDCFNGLILTPNLDALFDKGYISFDDEGEIIISSSLSVDAQKCLGIYEKMHLRQIDSRHLPYLKYHRENIFKK